MTAKWPLVSLGSDQASPQRSESDVVYLSNYDMNLKAFWYQLKGWRLEEYVIAPQSWPPPLLGEQRMVRFRRCHESGTSIIDWAPNKGTTDFSYK